MGVLIAAMMDTVSVVMLWADRILPAKKKVISSPTRTPPPAELPSGLRKQITVWHTAEKVVASVRCVFSLALKNTWCHPHSQNK